MLYLRHHSSKQASQGQNEEECERHNGADTMGGSEGCREGSQQQDNAQMSTFCSQEFRQTGRPSTSPTGKVRFCPMSRGAEHMTGAHKQKVVIKAARSTRTQPTSSHLCRKAQAQLPRGHVLFLIMLQSLRPHLDCFWGLGGRGEGSTWSVEP